MSPLIDELTVLGEAHLARAIIDAKRACNRAGIGFRTDRYGRSAADVAQDRYALALRAGYAALDISEKR